MVDIVNQMEKKTSVSPSNLLKRQAKAFCESTSIHGFIYWVNAPRLIEKLFWVAVVLTGFTCASLIIGAAFDDWQKNPGIVSIDSFSKVFIMRKIQG
jgi:hypothetical protein